MSKIRVLLVDDSVVIRKVLGDILSAESDIEIAGTASSGKLAIQKMPQVNPDIVILDVEMPDLNGLEALKILRRDYPKIPVVMFSTLTERGANTTLDALSAGAADYVCKPSNTGSLEEAKLRIKEELVPRIQALGTKSTRYLPPSNEAVKRMQSHIKVGAKYSPLARVDIVAIGISTGGPNAMATLLADIPGDLPVPIVVVQHMPPLFTKMLAERLNSGSQLTVFEATDKMELQPGCVYLAPGDYHMVVKRDGLVVNAYINQEQPENSCRPAVDVLFRSVVKVYGGNTLGVIMTGMGKDGYLGCELIKEVGGTVLAQDQASSVVWGMPGYVAEAGLADAVVPLDLLALEITRRVNRSQPTGLGKANVGGGINAMTVNGDDFTYITGLVRDEAAIVLESGKEYLVESRLSPLVRSEGLSSIADLVVRLKDAGHWPLRRKVVDALTTNETLFFRDLDPFEAIKKEVLPELIEKRQFERRLVIWSAACSSGQEACSLAILIKENFPVLESWNVKIVGTDICSAVLNKAKSGEYSQVEVNRGLPANYLIKHFSKEGLNWKVKDHIKRMVEFREFNLISNDWNQLPRFDLVMLRNVLIYFSTETKQGILANVRRVLAPDGSLFLGAAETTLGIDPGYNRSVCGKTSYYRPAEG